ncbi:hypothetical protein, partial [Thalassospira profundimaris]|uniref:hypothetical protein n=1 Tax=Thalassospira profundimaris TaxID=502049 RepID=UPI001EE67670
GDLRVAPFFIFFDQVPYSRHAITAIRIFWASVRSPKNGTRKSRCPTHCFSNDSEFYFCSDDFFLDFQPNKVHLNISWTSYRLFKKNS